MLQEAATAADVANKALDMVGQLGAKAEATISAMAPHVWQAEVAYWRTCGIMAWLPAILTPIVCMVLYKIGKQNPARSSYDLNVWFVMATIVGIVGLIAFVIAIGIVGPAAFAPEMYAIQDLIHVLK